MSLPPPPHRFTAWAEAEPSVRGLVLLGSRARIETPADDWSDTDLVVLTTEPNRWLASGQWLTGIGHPVVTFVEQTALLGLRERRVLFDDGSDVDLVITPVSMLTELLGADAALPVFARGHRVLVDKDDLLVGLAERVRGADPWAIRQASAWPPDPAEVADAIADYWYHCVWVTKKLRRGETWTAMDCLHGYQAAILLRFVEWQAKARSAGTAQTWFGGRYLERWAVPETVDALRYLFARYEPRDVAAALAAGMTLFGELAREVSGAASVSYDAAAEEWVNDWVRARVAAASWDEPPA